MITLSLVTLKEEVKNFLDSIDLDSLESNESHGAPSCPIACRLKERFPDYVVFVGTCDARFTDDGFTTVVKIPRRIVEWIEWYDGRRPSKGETRPQLSE